MKIHHTTKVFSPSLRFPYSFLPLFTLRFARPWEEHFTFSSSELQRIQRIFFFPGAEKASIEAAKKVTEDFAFPHWNIYFANPPNSLINEALHEILRGRWVPCEPPRAASGTLEIKLLS